MSTYPGAGGGPYGGAPQPGPYGGGPQPGPYGGGPQPGPYGGSPQPGPYGTGSYPAPGTGPYSSPYGTGPYPGGGPAGAPPGPGGGRRRGGRTVLLAVVAVLVIGLAVLALLAFAVGPRFARYDVLDAGAVERGVAEVLARDWRRAVGPVDCPEGVRVRAGVSFRCSATVDGRPRQVPVDVLDDGGTYQVGQPR